MTDHFKIFMGIQSDNEETLTTKKIVNDKEQKTKQIKKIKGKKLNLNKYPKNNQNEEPLFEEKELEIKNLKIPTNLFFSNKIMSFVDDGDNKEEDKNEKKFVNKEKVTNFKIINNIKSKNQSKFNSNNKEEEKSKIDEVEEKLENKKKNEKNGKVENQKETQVWKPRKCAPNYQSLNLKRDYQERNKGVYKKRKKNPFNEKFKKFNPNDLIPDFNINMVATAEIHILDLLRSESEHINKDNLYFKFMNEPIQWLLINPSNLSLEHKKEYEKNMAIFSKPQILYNNFEEQEKVLRDNFGYERFFDFQKEALSILKCKGMKTIVNSFTGSGKSLIYQYNALTEKGLTIVLIPYIAIIVDQIKKVPSCIPSLTLNSWLSYPQKKKFIDLIFENKVKLVFMTPEMFLGEFLMNLLEKEIDISMICVDETHCAVPWDVSFRVSYLAISQGLNKLVSNSPKINTLFLTATADYHALKYLRKEFDIPSENYVTTKKFVRENSNISFSHCDDQNYKILSVLRNKYLGKKPVLIFCNFKKSAESLSFYLQNNGVESFTFHGDMTEIQKLTVLQNLTNSNEKSDKFFSNVDVIIATLSLSMGLDVPDIKGVIHFNFPKYLESYIQQIGRSGRNGKIAECLVLLNKNDFYFSRNKTISSFLLNPDAIFQFVQFLQINHKNAIFINDEIMKNKFGVNHHVYKEMLSVVYIVLKNLGFELEIFYNFFNKINLKCYTKNNIFVDHFNNKKQLELDGIFKNNQELEDVHRILDFLKKCKRKGNEIHFNYNDMINELNDISIERIIILTKRLENLQNVGVIKNSNGILIRLKKELDEESREKTNKKIVEKLKSFMKKQLFKIDVFYFLASFALSHKNVEVGQNLFRTLTKEYFEKKNDIFREELVTKYNFESHCPIIYIKNKEQFLEIKDIFSKFFSENFTFIQDLLQKAKTHYEVYADSLRFLLGVSNEFFKTFGWDHPFCGILKFYAFEDYYEDIENIFKFSFKNLHNKKDDNDIVYDEEDFDIDNNINKKIPDIN